MVISIEQVMEIKYLWVVLKTMGNWMQKYYINKAHRVAGFLNDTIRSH